MAKNKKSIELSDKKISFQIKAVAYTAIRFFPTQMSVDVMVFEDGVKQGMQNIPFAHIPKETKKLIKPN